MDHEEKIAVVHRYVEAFEKSDMAIIREIFAEDAVVEDPVGTEPHVGIDAIEKFYDVGLSSGARLRLTGGHSLLGQLRRVCLRRGHARDEHFSHRRVHLQRGGQGRRHEGLLEPLALPPPGGNRVLQLVDLVTEVPG